MLGLLTATLIAQAGAPCSCDDLQAMRDRIAFDDGVIALYAAEAKSHPSPEMGTLAEYDAMEERVQKDISAEDLPDGVPRGSNLPGKRGPSSTDPVTCEVSVSDKVGSCMHEALARHEAFHEKVCRNLKTHYFKGSDPYFDLETLHQLAQDEVIAYGAERAFLRSQKAKLSAACARWSGSITYTRRMNPPDETRELHPTPFVSGTTVSHLEWSVVITITVSDNQASAQTEAHYRSVDSSHLAGKTWCRPNPYAKEVEASVDRSSTGTVSIDGSGSSPASVHVSMNGRSYSIGFSADAIDALKTITTTPSGNNPCTKRPPPAPPPPRPSHVKQGGVSQSVSGKTDDPDSLDGKDPGPPIRDGEMSVTWSLHRVSQK